LGSEVFAMRGLLKMSDAAVLAIHALALLADADQPMRVAALAEALAASENHLSKVLQGLAKLNMVSSVRGRNGGFTLTADPDSLTMLEIWEAIDGPMDNETCLLGHPECLAPEGCQLSQMVGRVREEVREDLSSTVLSDLRSRVKGFRSPPLPGSLRS